MILGATGMLLLTRLTVDSIYVTDVLPGLMLLGLAMGSIMPASMQTATLGVDRHFAGVASAMVNTSQQVGGSIGTALLNTIAATATTAYVSEHLADGSAALGPAAVAGYTTAFWWGAAFFAVGALLSAVLFRRRSRTPQATAMTPDEASEAVVVG